MVQHTRKSGNKGTSCVHVWCPWTGKQHVVFSTVTSLLWVIISANICKTFNVPCVWKHLFYLSCEWIWKTCSFKPKVNFVALKTQKIEQFRMKMNDFSLQILKNWKESYPRWNNDFQSSRLQKCPNMAKHAIYVLLPIVITLSVLQHKQNKWRDLMLQLIWSLTQPHCSKC